MEDGKNNER